jgi:hypothetical protein
MVDAPADLVCAPRSSIVSADGEIVPASVRWTSRGLTGLQFDRPVLIDIATPLPSRVTHACRRLRGRRMATETEHLLSRIHAAPDLPALEAERVSALGKQGLITGLLKSLGKMTPEERQAEGPRIHGLREQVTDCDRRPEGRLEAANSSASSRPRRST